MSNPLRHCLTGESAEVVDEILGPFLASRIGKNDMAVVTGLLASAAILIATHCQRTGEDYGELSMMCQEHFQNGLTVAGERIRSPRERP
jgi:hypothetical protein